MEWIYDFLKNNNINISDEIITALSDEISNRYVQKDEMDKKLSEAAIDMAISTALKDIVFDIPLTASLLDREKIMGAEKIEIGIEEAISSLKNEKPFLFKPQPEIPLGVKPLFTEKASESAVTSEVFTQNKNNPAWINKNWTAISKSLQDKIIN